MRTIRLFLYFIVGLMLGSVVVLAHAETIPATVGQSCGSDTNGPIPYSSCDLNFIDSHWSVPYQNEVRVPGVEGGSCGYRLRDYENVGFYGVCAVTTGFLSCPNGGTLSGANCIDVPPCPSGQVRDATSGACIAPPCEVGKHSSAARWRGTFATGSGDSVYGQATPMPATLCDGQCVGTPDTVTSCTTTSLAAGTPIKCSIDIILTGDQCSTGLGPSPVDPTIGKPNPPCAPGDGVMSGASGKVVCVPSTTPGATDPPVKTSTSKTSTAPDGSTSTTTTTNTCTGAGACSTTTNTTVTGVGGVPSTTPGVVPGQSGTPGTSTTVTDKPPENTSDFCAKNPQMQMCKGGMNEEATQKEVLAQLKSLSTPGTFNGEGLQQASEFATTEDLQGEDLKTSNAVGGISADPTQTTKSAWGAAMADGWFDPIPQTGCSPFTSNFAGRDISLDICPTAKRISDVGGYAMWFILAIGTFVMLTGGRSTPEA